MLVPYNWLKKYFDQDLPSVDELVHELIFHSFEVEDIRTIENDTVMEVKVLPDRAHDCLCHFGIAKEIGALFNLKTKSPLDNLTSKLEISETSRKLSIKIENEKLCRRYIGRVVENVEIKESPAWLTAVLNALEQKSINNIVDAGNYTMFDVGQPLHAFDADKIKGDIVIRLAKAGEKIITLDNQRIELGESMLVIADDDGPLAIAGVKGGKRAEVTAETKNLILEAANFDPVNVRLTTQQIGWRTDASKRFENELSTEIAGYAMDMLTKLIIDLAGTAETKIGPLVDEYKVKNIPQPIEFSAEKVDAVLGAKISVAEQIILLQKLGITVKKKTDQLVVTPPSERLDLVIKENYIEEIGRLYGYDKIKSQLPTKLDKTILGSETEAEKHFRIANKIREILMGQGFTEVYGYTFTDNGEIAVANPLASDKGFLRTNLSDWLAGKIKFNLPYLLFDYDPIKIFEIGTVFTGNNQEEMRLGLAVGYRKKIKGRAAETEMNQALEAIKEEIGWPGSLPVATTKTPDDVTVLTEINFEKLTDMAEPSTSADLAGLINSQAQYRPISSYPRIVRDVALWVPPATTTTEVGEIIKTATGPLLIEDPILFDEFIKDEKKSLAFRLVFQSYKKTLSDGEANEEMMKITKVLEEQAGFEVRK